MYEFEKDAEAIEVLICFIMWAYRGDFSTENIGILSQMPQSPPKMKEKKRRTSSWTLSDIQFQDLTPRNLVEGEPSLESENKEGLPTDSEGTPNENLDMKKTLHPSLIYVQVYEFAKIYLISSLGDISKEKIRTYLETESWDIEDHT